MTNAESDSFVIRISSLIRISGFVILVFLSLACRSTLPPAPPGPSLTLPSPDPDVLALVAPPQNWRPDPLKSSSRHTHRVWISPTGNTAFGVIHFSLPIPVPPSIVLPFFLREMKRDQGEAKLLEKHSDDTGLHFVCEGGLYKMRITMITQGFQGWAIYAGTLRAYPIEDSELHLAEQARDNTRIAP